MNELTTVPQLTAEIVLLKNQTAQNIIEIGKRLIQVKERLPHGEWGKWLEEKVDFSQEYARRLMKVSEEFGNSNLGLNLPFKKLFFLTSLEQDQREDFIQSNPIDEMTTRQLQQAIKEKKDLERQLEQERNKPPKVVERVVEKTVTPNDYEKLKAEHKIFSAKITQHEAQLERLEKEKVSLERKAKLNDQEAQEYKTLKENISKLRRERADLDRELMAVGELGKLVVQVERFIKEHLAPVKYSRALQELQGDKVVMDNVREMVATVQKWCKEMSVYTSTDYVEVQYEHVNS